MPLPWHGERKWDVYARKRTSLAGIPGCTGVTVGMGQLCQGSSCSDKYLFCVMMYCLKHDPYKDINNEKPSSFPLLFERIYWWLYAYIMLPHHGVFRQIWLQTWNLFLHLPVKTPSMVNLSWCIFNSALPNFPWLVRVWISFEALLAYWEHLHTHKPLISQQ